MASENATNSSPKTSPIGDFPKAAFLFYATGLLCAIGFLIGHHFFPTRAAASKSVLDCLSNWDGRWYSQIVTDGYRFTPGTKSNVAFFPGAPLAALAVQQLTGLRGDVSLAVVANLSLFGAFAVFCVYLRDRVPSLQAMSGFLTVTALAVYPPGFFLRMAYSESPFLFVSLLTIWGIQRRWPPWVVALLAGAAAGIRPVGVCVGVVVLWRIFRDSKSFLQFGLRIPLLPVAFWGLFAYMLFLHFKFDDAFAFAHVQESWRVEARDENRSKVLELVQLDPLWGVYDPESNCYWRKIDGELPVGLNIAFANPIYWTFAVALIVGGSIKGWLDETEGLLGALLLAFPYVFRATEMCMGSAARFTVVAFPIYIVLGQLLQRLPHAIRYGVLGASAVAMATYAGLYGAYHRIF